MEEFKKTLDEMKQIVAETGQSVRDKTKRLMELTQGSAEESAQAAPPESEFSEDKMWDLAQDIMEPVDRPTISEFQKMEMLEFARGLRALFSRYSRNRDLWRMKKAELVAHCSDFFPPVQLQKFNKVSLMRYLLHMRDEIYDGMCDPDSPYLELSREVMEESPATDDETGVLDETDSSLEDVELQMGERVEFEKGLRELFTHYSRRTIRKMEHAQLVQLCSSFFAPELLQKIDGGDLTRRLLQGCDEMLTEKIDSLVESKEFQKGMRELVVAQYDKRTIQRMRRAELLALCSSFVPPKRLHNIKRQDLVRILVQGYDLIRRTTEETDVPPDAKPTADFQEKPAGVFEEQVLIWKS